MLKLNSSRDIDRFVKPYRVSKPKKFSPADYDPADTNALPSEFKSESVDLLEKGISWMAEQQAMLAAQDSWSLLLIFQARDAAGKDSTIKHVMSGLNPQSCKVTSFKKPGYVALQHDYLWRYHQSVPERGQIGIFNRSHYEEVLVVRVHQKLLLTERLPKELISGEIWRQRFEDINNFERYPARNGVQVIKFFLNVSADQQKKRFLERLEHPEKHWKFSPSDIEERRFWDEYTHAYQDMIQHTSTKSAPWYIVPADHKWFTRLVVASVVVNKLRSLDLAYPAVDKATAEQLKKAKRTLD